MSPPRWTKDFLPDLTAKRAIVTGASSGLGKETVRVLAGRNARVILAVRSLAKGETVAAELRRELPTSDLAVRALDLASLASVEAFAETILAEERRLDLLINNAGVMVVPEARTRDGFELQMGTNHLGHFALAGRLLPLLTATAGARLVVLSSMAHKLGRIDLADLNWTRRRYRKLRAYCDSKLANLAFVYELTRRLEGIMGAPKVIAAHPGWSRTELQRHSPLLLALNHVFAQEVGGGVLPTLRAAVDPDARSGDYYGPSKFFEFWGAPKKVTSSARSHDRATARRLWALSEEMTGVSYPRV